jgi:hypothetical protein
MRYFDKQTTLPDLYNSYSSLKDGDQSIRDNTKIHQVLNGQINDLSEATFSGCYESMMLKNINTENKVLHYSLISPLTLLFKRELSHKTNELVSQELHMSVSLK